MARPTVIYNSQALFVGPAPESGYNFFNYNGGPPVNDDSSLVQKINRLNPIDRIQSITYSINVPHTNVTQLNTRRSMDRPIISYPTIDLSFNYLLCGTKNEARLGLDVNYPLYNFPFSGESYYTQNQSVSLLSGFFETNKNRVAKTTWEQYPVNQYKDCRNIYVVVNQEGRDVNSFYFKEDFINPDNYQSIDPNAPDYHVISFGNCYLQNYSTRGAIGTVPDASVSYTAYNVNFDLSGSGFQAPGIEAKSGEISPESKTVIPRILAEEGYSALHPGDITIATDSFSGLGVDFDKLSIQSYDISLDLNKENLESLAYKFPVDNRATSSIFAKLSIDGLVESGNSGSLVDLLSINSGYNFTIKVDPSNCAKSTTAPINAGTIPLNTEVEALRYTFLNAKLDSFDYNTDIGNNKAFSASFSVESYPEADQGNGTFSEGLFISGVLGMEKIEDFILLEGTPSGVEQDGFYLQQENDNLLVTNLLSPY
jgi:hypothetical protein